MIKEVIVGVNSTGKTEYLNEKFSDENNEAKLMIPTEMILDEEVKSANKAKGTFVIDNILPIIFEKIDVNMSEKKEELSDDINRAIARLDNEFVNKFSFNDRWNYEKLLENTIKSEFDSLGSGDKSKYILDMINKLELQEFKIFIDEPEKFAHPSLQVEIAKIINEIALNNDVYLVTHSPTIVQNINIANLSDIMRFTNNGMQRLSDEDLKTILSNIVDSTACFLLNTGTDELNAIECCDDFLNLTYIEFRNHYFMDIYKELIFYSKVLFTEDINTKYYIDGIIKSISKDIDTIDVGGKVLLLVWNAVASQIDINNSVVYDTDQKIEYDATNRFTGSIQPPVNKQIYYNSILGGLCSESITVDIEHSVLGYQKYNSTTPNQLSKADMKEINKRKTRIDTRLKLKKAAESSCGYDFIKIKTFLQSM